jgi:hypothetical protein
LRYLILSQARLPIPPQGHLYGAGSAGGEYSGANPAVNGPRGRFFRRRDGAFGRVGISYPSIDAENGQQAANWPAKEPRMNEDVLNTSLRKFLKTVGVTSQREIEMAIRDAVAAGRIKGNEALKARMVLTIDAVGLSHTIDATVELE